MKRQDDSGCRLAVDSIGSGGSSVDIVGINGVAPSVGNGTTDSGTQRVVLSGSTTATLSNVAGNAGTVTLLAANAARAGATIQNDSSAILYVKFGAAATTSSYTVKMVAGAYYEVPFQYTGLIAGIWDSATGNARMTEITT